MKYETKTSTIITIVLSREEAEILASLVQNPQCNPSDELIETAELREALLSACKSHHTGIR